MTTPVEQLGTLFRKDRVAIRKIILEYQSDFDEVDDWMMDVFLRAVEKIDSFRGDSSLLTWVCGIAKSVCVDHIRVIQADKRPELILAASLDSCVDEEGSGIDYYDRALHCTDLMQLCAALDPAVVCEAHDALAMAVSDMPERMAEAVVLRYEGLPSAEIAELMGCTVSTVDNQIALGKQIITELIEI